MINQCSDEAVYRTAPATQVLLKIAPDGMTTDIKYMYIATYRQFSEKNFILTKIFIYKLVVLTAILPDPVLQWLI